MTILLDTNVVSELRKLSPDSRVVDWVNGLDEDRIFLSVVTLAEIRFGIARLAARRRRSELTHWLEVDLLDRFVGRIIDIDREIALFWGDLMYDAQKQGRTLAAMDGMVAATAVARRLALATRNSRDFAGLRLDLVDPWAG